MSDFSAALESLLRGDDLTPGDLLPLFTPSAGDAAGLHDAARSLTVVRHGAGVKIRGLMEITNCCRNNCYYCGLRAANTAVSRYAIDPDEAMRCVRTAYSAGFRTIVMQGGENPASDGMIERLVAQIKDEFPDCVVTLSLGERPRQVYARWRAAGAARYLLRHETAVESHYRMLHPEPMTLEARLECPESLRAEGYEIGMGMMVGSPSQTTADLAADLLLLRRIRPDMVGMGPFIPHADTPFGRYPAGDVGLTCRLISIVRLMLPEANIPATTAMATLAPDGRRRALDSGANVLMPNITPMRHRGDYALYNGKASTGTEGDEGLRALDAELRGYGRHLLLNKP